VRTLTDAQAAALAAPDRTPGLRVEIDSDGAGTFVDLCDLDGFDYVQSASYGEESDSGPADAEIMLTREFWLRSLSPMVDGSAYAGYVELGRAIRIKTAVVPFGATPQDSDFALVFSGRVNAIDFGGSRSMMRLACLDDAGVIQDTFIETQNTYGSDLGDDIEDVMQDILDDWVNTSPGVPYTLNVPVSPGFLVLTYQQTKQNVLEALRTLADLIGWDVRMRWDSVSSSFKLTFFTPDRTPSSADYTFDPDRYFDVTKLTQELDPIRNAIAVVFEDSTNNNARTRTVVTDATSISLYGRRYMEITEAASNGIDTPTEASTMANSALSDLSTPGAEQNISVPYFWPGEVGDFYEFLANGQHYDSNQEWGAVSLRHTLSPGSMPTTVIATRGKPSTGTNRWLSKEARGGNAPGANLEPPDAAGTISATPGVGSIRIDFDEPTDPEWAYSEVYIDTSSIATPTYPTKPSSSLLEASGKANRFVISGLDPQTQYYVLVLNINYKGEWISSASQIQTATEAVGPYHENLDGQQDQLLRNNDFNVFTKGTGAMPDRWSVGTGSYASGGGANTVYVNTADHRTGNRCLDLFYSSTANSPEIISDAVPFQDSDILRAAVVARMDTGGTNTDPEVRISLRWLDKDRATISTTTPLPFDISTTWTRFVSGLYAAPSTTRYVQILLAAGSTGDSSTAFTLQLDKASIIRGKGTSDGVKGQSATSTLTIIDFNTSNNFGVAESAGTYTFSAPGQWRARAAAVIIDDGTPPAQFSGTLQLRVNSVQVALITASSQADPAADEVCALIIDETIEVDEGDTLDVRISQDQGGSIGAVESLALTQIFREETS
jgi:hypothetical protein